MSNGLSHWILNNISGQGSKYLRFARGVHSGKVGFITKNFQEIVT